HRMPGAAVFIHNGSYVSHVGFLWKPVTSGKPEGDWWVIEARGVMYGVVATKLNARGWNRWGLMIKYFDYSDVNQRDDQGVEFGHRKLSYGDTGADVKALQEALISLGYSCGKWGADGEFGKATRSAVVAFQSANSLVADGIVGPKTVAAINALLPESGEEPEASDGQEPTKPQIKVTGGSVYLRTHPATSGAVRAVVHLGDLLPSAGDAVNGWFPVVRDGEVCYISGKYAEKMTFQKSNRKIIARDSV
ncbi:peptidoglycan-binding protein, partial [Bacillota bacterium Meth-B3]